MRTHFALPALPLLLAAACGGGGGSTDIDQTLRFADRSDQEISRLMNAAAGTDMFQAQAQMDQFGDTFDEDPCPQIVVDGNTATVTGGCTRLDGTTQVQGSMVVTNPSSWDQIEDFQFGEDTLYEATALAIVTENFSQTFDGFIRRTDSFQTWDADITVTMFDMTVRSDIHYECTNPNAPRCTLSGSGLELPGVGGAHVSGSVSIDLETNRQVSSFTLEGADTLTVHVEDNCIEWSISGTDRGMDCP
jgi:hypothetical protein